MVLKKIKYLLILAILQGCSSPIPDEHKIQIMNFTSTDENFLIFNALRQKQKIKFRKNFFEREVVQGHIINTISQFNIT